MCFKLSTEKNGLIVRCVAELSLNRCDIAGFLYEVPAHGMAGVMGRMALDAGQAAYLVEHHIKYPRVETIVALSVGVRLD